MDRKTLLRVADDTIGLFLEYRDTHGYDESAARAAAVREIGEAHDAATDAKANGESLPRFAAALLGSVKSERKAAAVRLNGAMPCAPGKRRGRPRKEK